jgi:hypothetical protein
MTNNDTLHSMIDHTDACSTDPYRDDDMHDMLQIATRDLLCIDDDDTIDMLAFRTALIDDFTNADPFIFPSLTTLNELRAALIALDTDSRSALCLDYSLCPMHRIDYCACFDDDDPECAAIRACFPNHDT